MGGGRHRLCSGLALLALWSLGATKNISVLPIPSSGNASLTHYDLSLGAVASCGCSADSSYYPTAALSQAAYGSSLAAGPACGQCFNLTLVQTYGATPEWVLSEEERVSVVVKITDKCPAPSLDDPDKTWCGASAKEPNGMYFHFDLATPSPALPLSFFPTNSSYGYSDFGSWLVQFETTSCANWAGWSNQSALGLDPSLTAESGCCPANPLSGNTTCRATSLKVGAASRISARPDHLAFADLFLLVVLSFAFIA
ncbi:hypothetical protein JCM21900_006580 [Sporobolomyces salmonicolor]